MILEITNPDVDNLIRELVKYTDCEQKSTQHELLRIGRACAALPVLDARSADEILGYDSIGVPS